MTGTPSGQIPVMTQPRVMFAKYRLLARLASGGMADVFLAASGFAGGASKLLVLKRLRQDLPEAERPTFAHMFEDEGRLAMRLNHPSIVQSYEVGVEAGQSFIAMEYLEGQPFSSIQERGFAGGAQALSLEMQLDVLCQVLEGLEYAHALTDYDGRALDIVHRDVSPQNVFVTYAGHTKLVDFGIAKTLESQSKTAAGVVKGKVRYLSPEQVKGGAVDRRADLFSVGVMLWESIARRRMHAGATPYEVLQRLVKGELPPLREAVPEVDPALERIVARALAPDPKDRFPSAAALREELQHFLAGRAQLDPRAIGDLVARDFARERGLIAELIRREMNDADAPTVRLECDAAPKLEAALSLSLLPTRRARALSSSLETRPTRVADTIEQPGELEGAVSERPVATPVNVTLPPRRRRWLAILAALGALSCVAAWAVQRSSELRQAAARAESGAARSVSLRIGAYPGDATITLDAEPLAHNPYEGRRSADLGPHTLEVSAPGYLTQRYEVLLDRDLDVDFALTPVPAPKELASSAAAELRRAGALPRPARVPSRLRSRGEQ